MQPYTLSCGTTVLGFGKVILPTMPGPHSPLRSTKTTFDNVLHTPHAFCNILSSGLVAAKFEVEVQDESPFWLKIYSKHSRAPRWFTDFHHGVQRLRLRGKPVKLFGSRVNCTQDAQRAVGLILDPAEGALFDHAMRKARQQAVGW